MRPLTRRSVAAVAFAVCCVAPMPARAGRVSQAHFLASVTGMLADLAPASATLNNPATFGRITPLTTGATSRIWQFAVRYVF